MQSNGPLVRRCYYTLVSVLDSLYSSQGVVEHTGEVLLTLFLLLLLTLTLQVRLAILRTFLALRANSQYHLGLPRYCSSTTSAYPGITSRRTISSTGINSSTTFAFPGMEDSTPSLLSSSVKGRGRALSRSLDWICVNIFWIWICAFRARLPCSP